MREAKRQLAVDTVAGFDPETGRWLWALEDVRRVLKARLNDLPQALIDYQPPSSNSVGTLLYHIALVEADWLYVEVLGGRWDPAVQALLPHAARTDDGRLTPVPGVSAAEHIRRLDAVRQAFLGPFRGMSVSDWRRPRVLPEYTVTPEWVVYHLIEHEAHHRGQIFDLLRRQE
jgi:uncharacterized damage-inducible protein DinB